MERLPPTLALIVLFALVMLAMRHSWRARARRQMTGVGGRALPAPSAPGAAPSRVLLSADGLYISTTWAGEHLERITAHGLGMRSPVRVVRHDGAGPTEERWEIHRQGAPSFVIPASSLTSAFTAPGMAGRWIGKDALVVLRWRLGEHEVDTGLRLPNAEEHAAVLQRAAADAADADADARPH